jgi:ATP-binding cassette subfamily C protein
VGVGLVYAFLKAVMEPQTLGGIPQLSLIYEWLAFKELHIFFAFLTLSVMAVFLIRIFMQFVGAWMMLWIRKQLQLRVAGVLFSGYMKAPYTRHLSSKSSVLMNNVTTNAAAAVAQCTLGLVEIASAMVLAAVFIATLLVAKPLETLIAVLVIGVLGATYWSFMHERLIIWGQRMMRANEQVYSAVAETALAIKTIKVSQVESAFEQRFNALVKEQMGLVMKNGLAQNLPRFVLEIVIVVGVFGVMLSVFLVGKTVESIIPTMALFGLAALRIAPAIVRIIAALQLYRNSVPSLAAILPDYLNYNGRPNKTTPQGASSSSNKLARSIVLEDLSFSYEAGAKPAVASVSFEILKGQLVGFAGPSGSGKSTTADILLGLLQPENGRVLIDGRPYTAGLEGPLAGMFAYVPQEPVILDDTIRNNIAFGVSPDAVDDEKVWAALKDAALYAKVQGMANGLSSSLGERGNTFSGGERQRLGIARALYMSASVIILDEPTASLDASTEFEVTEAIRRLRGNKTIIVIAHRLSSIAHCDKIFFFENGQITGQGTFERLMRDVPAFQEMVAHLSCDDPGTTNAPPKKNFGGRSTQHAKNYI